MSKLINLTGEKFGRLTVIKQAGVDNFRAAMWECRCACGNIVVIRGDSLRSGATRSCGCLANIVIDLTKEKFGRLTVIERAENTKQNTARWKCQCDCGNIVVVPSSSLKSGNTRSCGCLAIEATKQRQITHGMYNSPEYNVWRCMVQRCNSPKNPAYKKYGARGIAVCEKWLKFDGFFEDMGNRPKGLTLERRDNMAGYCKSNCCWASYSQQNRNRRILKANKTGTTGVSWIKARGKYQAYINIEKNKRLDLGCFVELEQAAEARKQAEQKYWGKR